MNQNLEMINLVHKNLLMFLIQENFDIYLCFKLKKSNLFLYDLKNIFICQFI